VVICLTAWRGKRRSLAGSVIALALVFCGLALSPVAVCEQTDSEAIPGGSGPDPRPADTPPFLGNIELKARLDAPGNLAVAGERMHGALLRRFYIAHGYRTVWDSRPEEASRLRDAVLRAGDHGLDPGLFHSAALGERGSTLLPVERDLLLSDAFLSYADALSRGAMPIEDRTDD